MNPFEQLRHHDRPEAPSARFAGLLRTRVEQALAGPTPHVPDIRVPQRSTTMTTPDAHIPVPGLIGEPVAPVAFVVPYLCVDGAAAALDWYVAAFGAVETVRYVGDDGRVGHAEFTIGGARVMLSDPYPELAVVAPDPSGSSVALNVNVPDVDAVFAGAVAGGARVLREPEDQPYGERSATILDPFGHRWMLQTTIATPTVEEIDAAMEGFTVTASTPPASAAVEPVEVGYLTIGFDDTTRAKAFYGALFGWETEDGSLGSEYQHIENTKLPMGMSPSGSSSPVTLYFRVDDANAFAQRAVELGGRIVSDTDYESGGDVVCVDDQGREFHLWQPAPGY